jgi:hypothetical protein
MEKVLALGPIAYWPLNESSGAVAYDISGNGYNGAHTGVTLGQTGIGDGNTCPLFDGTNDFTNVYTTGFRDAFNGAEGTLQAWARVFNVGVWTDGLNARRIVNLRVDADNFIRIRKSANNTIIYEYKAGGTTENQSKSSMTTTDWFHVAVTWSVSADAVTYYYDGAQEGTPDATLGTWVGDLASTQNAIGAATTTPDNPWHGYLAHCAVWTSVLTPTQIATLAVY